MKTSAEVLSAILQSADQHRLQGKAPLRAVFDLDSTLFCVSQRTEKILRTLGEQGVLYQRFGDAVKQLSQVHVDPKDWGIPSALKRLNVGWDEALRKEVAKAWAQHFFSSGFLSHDEPYPGAVEFTQELRSRGAEIFYLTGRDRPNMEPGTVDSLRQWGFPLDSADRLIMKPDSRRHDAEFKRDALIPLIETPADVWYFENEPVIIEMVRFSHPGIKIVFMDSVHSGRATPPDDLPTLNMQYRWR